MTKKTSTFHSIGKWSSSDTITYIQCKLMHIEYAHTYIKISTFWKSKVRCNGKMLIWKKKFSNWPSNSWHMAINIVCDSWQDPIPNINKSHNSHEWDKHQTDIWNDNNLFEVSFIMKVKYTHTHTFWMVHCTYYIVYVVMVVIGMDWLVCVLLLGQVYICMCVCACICKRKREFFHRPKRALCLNRTSELFRNKMVFDRC